MKALRCLLMPPVAFAFLALTLAPRPATADVVTYSVSGSFGNGATFLPGSTLTIDTTAGTVSNSDLLVSAGNNPSPPNTFTDANLLQNGSSQRPFEWGLADTTDLEMFNGPMEFQGFSPLGGTVGLVTYFGPWGFSNGSSNTVLTLTPVATPLPAALPLFATGLGALGLLGWRRKKKVTALAA
ncbi:MAG TPA: hypothetical protein VHT68_25230 [Pseudolabrys sp.]|nr:hypothetical protein [Pseudolabrys sp.]